MTGSLSPEREQQIRAEILAALSTAGAFCGECGFEPGETGCADCVRVRELYADAVMPVIDRLRAELAQARSHALTEAVERLTWMQNNLVEGNPRRQGVAFSVGVVQAMRDFVTVPAVGEATR